MTCSFPTTWNVTKYDGWAFYLNQFRDSCKGNKGVDFLGIDPASKILWMVEIKDYREHRRTKDTPLWDEVAIKARDTLAGLFAAKIEPGHADRAFAIQGLICTRLHIVLHLEQPRTHSKMFPRAFDRANVQQKLKQLVRPIDAHPRVVELGNMDGVPWTATSR